MNKASLVVFAGGEGTRMRPLTDYLPKAMLPVLDVPLIDLALIRGDSVDCANRFVNASGALPDLRRHMKRRRPDVEVLDEGLGPIGQAATLRALLPRLARTVVTYNCDLVSDLDLPALLKQHGEGEKLATLAVQPVTSEADIVREKAGVRLVDRRREDARGFIFLGAGCFESELLDDIAERRPLGLTEGLLQPAIDSDEVLLVEHPGYARDCGTLQRYLEVCLDALDPQRLRIDTPGTLSPEGWYLGPGSTAAALPGKGTILLAGSSLEEEARVADCIVWPGSTVPSGVEVSGGIWFRDRFLVA
ncbi:MAG: NDP-sugar synthase [Actinobacteria bacterium]|nr:NDP-sugar synthase [Actinomycetota bacterium]